MFESYDRFLYLRLDRLRDWFIKLIIHWQDKYTIIYTKLDLTTITFYFSPDILGQFDTRHGHKLSWKPVSSDN